MDTKPILELKEALKTWRAGLSELSSDDLDELESHVFDSMAELQASGLTEAEAFDVAVRRLGNPVDLAAELGARSGVRLPHGVAAASAEGGFGWRRVASGLLLVLGAAGVLLAGWGAWGALRPVRYTGRVLFERPPMFRLEKTGVEEAEGGVAKPPVSDVERVYAEAELIRSASVLERVVKRHELTRRWNLADSDQAVARLRSMVTLSTERGTDLVKLELRHTDLEETPWLANAVAEAFIAHQSEAWEEGRAEREQRMVKYLEEKEETVEAARQELLRAIQQPGRAGMGDSDEGVAAATGDPDEGVGEVKAEKGSPAAEANRWAVDRAKAAYEGARANLEEAKNAMRLMARSQGRASIQEYATEPIVYGNKRTLFVIIFFVVLAVLGLALLAAGWRIGRRGAKSG